MGPWGISLQIKVFHHSNWGGSKTWWNVAQWWHQSPIIHPGAIHHGGPHENNVYSMSKQCFHLSWSWETFESSKVTSEEPSLPKEHHLMKTDGNNSLGLHFKPTRLWYLTWTMGEPLPERYCCSMIVDRICHPFISCWGVKSQILFDMVYMGVVKESI